MDYNPAEHSLKCPKCGHGMIEVSHEYVVVDRCTHCHGLWFDADEAHQLKIIKGSQDIDIGDPNVGWKWDSRTDIDCPRCGNRMHKTADPKQVHIWYEVCHNHGMFMDAGEFKDFKFESLLDWFRSLIKGDRNRVMP
jgi:Zn-finger nucleic acid-binding protein